MVQCGLSGAESSNLDLAIVTPVHMDPESLLAFGAGHAGMLASAREWIVVDSRCDAESQRFVTAHGGRYLYTSPSRGGQIAKGIEASSSSWLWVVHVDSRIERSAFDCLSRLIDGFDADCVPGWGRFDIELPGLPVVSAFMNWRSRFTKICTGDQSMFFARSLLEDAGGFPNQPLMEDIEVSKRLKNTRGRFCAPKVKVRSSARRWQRYGRLRTVLSMWRFRWAYFRGVSAQQLYDRYYSRAVADECE